MIQDNSCVYYTAISGDTDSVILTNLN